MAKIRNFQVAVSIVPTSNLMGRRTTNRYKRKGTIHNNQGFFNVGRNSLGQFVTLRV